jgi:hypothetical protein
MKIEKVIVFSIILCQSIFSQIDTTNWYPLQIGNKWEYSYGIESVYYYSDEVVGDTIMPNGKHYFIMNDNKYLRNEDNNYLYEYNRFDSTESILYDFISKDRTIWEIPSNNYLWGIQITKREYNYYLDKNTEYKYYDWVKIDSSSNGIDTMWNAMIDVYPTRIAKGIGVTNYNYNDYPGSGGLIGAVINGDTLGTITSLKEQKLNQNNYNIYQNYPNPFNPITNIEFSIPHKEYVEFNIYNSLGQKIISPINKILSSGNHTVKFDGNNLSSGIYFYQIKTKNYSAVKKMLLLK